MRLCLETPRIVQAADEAQNKMHCIPWLPFHNIKERRFGMNEKSNFIWWGFLAHTLPTAPGSSLRDTKQAYTDTSS